MAKLPGLGLAAETDRICERLREATLRTLRRRGLVVAMSGGIDSSVCAALAVRALGKERVFGLLLPERDSSGASSRLGRLMAEFLDIEHALHDISSTLAAIGCYSEQEEVLRRVLPGFGGGWKFKLAIVDLMAGRIAVTNFKQRVRKTIEYYHADRLNYAVVGTPNRLEYDQGFFVKNGDGAADVKPIAHLYKTHVYDLARHLGLPESIVQTTPTTDTFSLAQGQDEFYFRLPYGQMDLALWHLNEGLSAAELAREIGCDEATAERTYETIRAKRRTTAYLHAAPILVEPVPQVSR
jgi:NAD+ synthase